MAKYNVRGLNPFNRVKTLAEALQKALPYDEIFINGSEKKGSFNKITSGVTINGSHTTLKCPEHKICILANGSGELILKDINIIVDGMANGISVQNWQGKLTLENVNIQYSRKANPKKLKIFPAMNIAENPNLDVEFINSYVEGFAATNVNSITVTNSTINGTRNQSFSRSKQTTIQSSKLENTTFESKNLKVSDVALSQKNTFKGKGEVTKINFNEEGTNELKLIGTFNLHDVHLSQLLSSVTFSNGQIIMNNVIIDKILVVAQDVTIARENGVQNQGKWNNTNVVFSDKSTDTKKRKSTALVELNKLIGLGSVKQKIIDYVNAAKVSKARSEAGLKNIDMSLHLVFSGNPGTGKTTVARLFGQALFEGGVLPKNKMVSCLSSDLIDNIVGGTAIKTRKKIEEALGGVLFIDEAYQLAPSDGNEFANEAVTELVAQMENHRKDLVVVLAGYTDDMKDFFNRGNTGLKSRFSNWVDFPDYSYPELCKILQLMLLGKGYQLTGDSEKIAYKAISVFYQRKLLNGNARSIRNFVQKIIFMQSNRISKEQLFDKQSLSTITTTDVNNAYKNEWNELVNRFS